MRYHYDIIAEVNTGDVVPSMMEIQNELNHHMNYFGFPEKLVIQSKGPIGQIVTSLKLSDEDLLKTINIIRDEFKNSELLNKFTITELKLI